jgi:hypothetical protein
MAQESMDQLAARAQQAIDNDEDFVYDLAAECSQQVGNVKHMTWFKQAVMRDIAENQPQYEHLLAELA